MARFAITPSGDVVLAMSVAEALGLQRLLSKEEVIFENASQKSAATRAAVTLQTAVADAKGKNRNRALHSQREALARMDREEGWRT